MKRFLSPTLKSFPAPAADAASSTTLIAARLMNGTTLKTSCVGSANKCLTFRANCVRLFEVMRDMKTYKLYWKDEDTNRVRSEEFSNKTGWDHSAMDAALEMAEEADANLFPWLLEEDGYVVAFGRGGERLGSAIRFA